VTIKTRGDARIERATSPTQKENHTTRPITHASATGIEPVREFPSGFQVHRLNHSAKLTKKKSIPAGLEPAPLKENALAGHRVNHSAMVSE
tara:strand:- start:199 stop:471 length:273 start_codon:yes stop_codon:yes gene_type:complete